MSVATKTNAQMSLVTLRVRFEMRKVGGGSTRGVLDLVNALHRSLESQGGSAFAVRRPGFVLIEATVSSVAYLEEWFHGLGEMYRRKGEDCDTR